MRVSRLVPVLVASAVFTASAAPAAAATPGVGATVGSLEVLSLDVGDLLALDLLTDFAAANTDAEAADAGGFAAIKALAVDAPLLLPDPVEVGVLDVTSTGEEKTASNNSLDLVDAAPVVGGALLPIALSAALTEPGATSTTEAGIAALDILEGIAGLDTTELGISANALTEQADGSRRLVLDNLAVLNIGDLLAGLGIPLDLLPLGMVLDLIDGLGLTDQLGAVLDGAGVPLDLENLNPASIADALEGLAVLEQGVVSAGDDAGALCGAVDGYLGDLPALPGLPGGIDGGIIGTEEVCDEVESILADLPLIGDVLDAVLALLSDTALIELNALDVSIVTKATDSLDTSAATITATLGGVTVAGLEIPEVDLDAAIETAKAQLDDLLAIISPLLDDLGLLDVGVLEQESSVTEDGDAITSTASFTGLRVDVAGLSDEVITNVLAGLAVPVEPEFHEMAIGGLLDSLPANPITDLLGQTDALSALGDGLSLRVASLGQTSTFTEVLNTTATPAAPAAPSLPQTGSNDALMLALAALAAGGALGIRRVIRTKD